MNTKIVCLALFSLMATTSTLLPASAIADSDDRNYRDGKQQSEHSANRQANTPQRAERERAQRVERNNPQRVERERPQRAERQERGEQKPAVVQQQRYTQPRRSTATTPRRTFHIERPRHISRPNYFRHVPPSRYYRGIHIYRPYGYLYPGFGFYYSDHDAFRWIAFTALTLTISNQLDEPQQRMHEQAMIRATSADVGDTLYWDDGHTSGSVTVLHIGIDSRGREQREFRQSVSTHGRTETSYASAYLKANGTWEVLRSR